MDSTPKIFFYDDNKNGVLETGDGDKVILVCGQRKGGTSYFALDVTNPDDPQYLWGVSQYDDNEAGTLELQNITGTFQDNVALSGSSGGAAVVNGTIDGTFLDYDSLTNNFAVGETVTDGTSNGDIVSISEDAPYFAPPTTVISELGETWSEPQFGLVKTASGDTHVLFVGGGYSSDNSKGKTVLAIDVITGAVVKQFTSGMIYSFPGTVSVIDEDGDGYVDKVYAGDLGGQMWRFASFADPENPDETLAFPECNEIIDYTDHEWTGQVFFQTDENHSRKFFYPPSITLEKGYDLVFMGTGDRENACCNNVSPTECSSSEPDILCAVKDTHSPDTIIGEQDISGTLYAKDLLDVTDPSDTPPNLNDPTGDVDGNGPDQGWYIRLVDDSDSAVGEKVLAESTVFYKVFYITTFTPN
ncbi:MAG: hypothetical protein JRC89_07075, partial [Deltaproteobacteria bacterium]|nr:hypothetical protein [Deltaproteobacteria bacterium]